MNSSDKAASSPRHNSAALQQSSSPTWRSARSAATLSPETRRIRRDNSFKGKGAMAFRALLKQGEERGGEEGSYNKATTATEADSAPRGGLGQTYTDGTTGAVSSESSTEAETTRPAGEEGTIGSGSGAAAPTAMMFPEYSLPSYWEERYATTQSEPLDWYVTYEDMRHILRTQLNRLQKAKSAPQSTNNEIEILIPGCGTSLVGEKLYKAGFRNVSCIDISSCLISDLRDRYRHYGFMDFSVLDATSLSRELPRECFNLIIDKGLLDSLLCGDDGGSRGKQMLWEMLRLLTTDGCYICVSHADPKQRIPVLENIKIDDKSKRAAYKWDIKSTTVETAAKTDVFYVYTCTKAYHQQKGTPERRKNARKKT